jgi:pyruvate dehydrogenase E1 component
VRAYAEQIRAYVPMPYHVLGTDGFGRSDTRERLRDFFEVDRRWIALKALHALVQQGSLPKKKLGEALARYGIDPDKPNPLTV